MRKAAFETMDGDEVEVDPAQVIRIAHGEEDETTIVELDDGRELTVVAAPLEVAAELGLDPFEFIDGQEDDDALSGFPDDEDEDYEEE